MIIMEKLEKLNQEEYQEKDFFVSNNFGKILKLNKSGYILNRAELETISRTPKKECFICDAIVNNCLGLEPEKFYLLPEDILDDGFEEHLKQIFSKLYYYDRKKVVKKLQEDWETIKYFTEYQISYETQVLDADFYHDAADMTLGELGKLSHSFILKMNKIIENMGDSILEDSDTKKVLLKSIELMDEQQKVELYEHFHGGTYSTSQFYDWIEKDLS